MRDALPVTTTFFLIRHAAHALLGRVLAGRMPDVHLDAKGFAQATELRRRFEREHVTAIHSSPRERAVETAREIAGGIDAGIVIEPAIDEIDCGEWTGRSFDELRGDPRWISWNKTRSTARAPDGESMIDVQKRAVGYLDQQYRVQPDACIIAVSHGDVIKAALFACLDLSLDRIGTIEISPAGVSTIVIGDWGSKILSINEAASP